MPNRSTKAEKRNESPPTTKPEKPSSTFPLFPHASGQWAKKIRGKLHYFGVWATPDKARERFEREWPYLKEGKTPPPETISEDGCTLRDLANDFLLSKQERLKAGELSPLSFADYHRTCEGLIGHFGKDRRVDDLRPSDFRDYRAKLAKRFGVTRLKNEINRVLIVFKYASDSKHIEMPVHFGQEFERPSAKQLRRHRNQSGPKLFNREEILALTDAADVHLRAMIYLGINCAFGPTDCATLPIKALDMTGGWINYPRPKTEIPRRIPLWPETMAALRESLADRPDPAQAFYSGLYFLTRFGVPWERIQEPKKKEGEEEKNKPPIRISSIGRQFGKIRGDKNVGRPGLGFYTLRHVFETVGGESKDQVAVDAIMGHVDSSMGGNYRHAISDDRLRAVVDVVREWLFPPGEGPVIGKNEIGEEGGAT